MPTGRLFRGIGSCKLKLGAAKLAAGDKITVRARAYKRRLAQVAGGGVLVRICRADFKCLLEPMPRLATSLDRLPQKSALAYA